RDGMASDIKIGDLPILKNSEIQNFCLHGTVGSGKSEVIRRLLNYVRARGDMAIIYDRSCEFVKSYYDPSLDKILNPLDSRYSLPAGHREERGAVHYPGLDAR
ncbi:type IV secretion system DNA-binding domain-containing protein, partial [Klebsiella pneumoniae]|uniref:type IV secretion system DNA-binding domain-containing protein n=1 Tax=Klebsiella pneumoniae TaxID=573 RepID=UPI00396F6577